MTFDGLKFHRASVRYVRMRRTYRFQRRRLTPREGPFERISARSFVLAEYIYNSQLYYLCNSLRIFYHIMRCDTNELTRQDQDCSIREETTADEKGCWFVYTWRHLTRHSVHTCTSQPLAFLYICTLALVNFLCKRFSSDSRIPFWRAFSITG